MLQRQTNSIVYFYTKKKYINMSQLLHEQHIAGINANVSANDSSWLLKVGVRVFQEPIGPDGGGAEGACNEDEEDGG